MALGTMVLAVVLLVAAYRLAAPSVSEFAPTGPVLTERLLRFEDRADGGIVVHDARSGATRVIEPGADPFVRGALRALVRERRSLGIGSDIPFQLVARTSGRLTLVDPSTQRRLDIESFGPAQSTAFARLLDLAPPTSTAALVR
jgi:putative photosynthetic complex assembly protein